MNKFITFSFILTSFFSFGQTLKAPINLQSPNASSLGLYGEVPVSFATGLPSIIIPIFNVEEGGLSVPINVNYHASGVKPDAHAGWIGLGFNLSAGGSISRIIRDRCDEDVSTVGSMNGPLRTGYYYAHSILDKTNWNTQTYLRDVTSNLAINVFDTEPDEFSFNFLGFSGKFYRSHKGQWVVESNHNFK